MIQSAAYTLEECALLGASAKRRNDIAVFVGRAGGRLADNVKYLYLHAAGGAHGFYSFFFTRHRDEYDLLKKAGLPVITLDNEGVKILTQTGVLVMDDLPVQHPEAYLLGRGARMIQLWHGIPLKKIGFPEIESSVNMDEEKKERLRSGYSACEIVASTSPWVTEHLFSKVFGEKEFMECGYPRNDVLLRPLNRHDLLNADAACCGLLKTHKRSGGKVVVYMPTFRDTGLDFRNEAGDFVLDPPALARFAAEHKVIFLLKLHPYVDDGCLASLPGVLRCPSHMDIYPLLPFADALITDYSSVYMDYLLLNRPIHFFAYDERRYCTKDRELFFPYEDMTPGPIARTQGELLTNLKAGLIDGRDEHEQERLELREKLFAHVDAGAAQRICLRIRELLRNTQAAA